LSKLKATSDFRRKKEHDNARMLRETPYINSQVHPAAVEPSGFRLTKWWKIDLSCPEFGLSCHHLFNIYCKISTLEIFEKPCIKTKNASVIRSRSSFRCFDRNGRRIRREYFILEQLKFLSDVTASIFGRSYIWLHQLCIFDLNLVLVRDYRHKCNKSLFESDRLD